MHIFILGGNSAHNKEWAYNLQKALVSLADTVTVHEYAHWSNGEQFIDLDAELKALATIFPTTDEYIFVAKSMGSVLATMGMYQKLFKPAACIMLGVPLQVIESQQIPFTDWLSTVTCNLTYVQNDHDPLGSFVAVKAYLHDIVTDAQLHMLPGETHDYTDFDMLERIVADAIQTLV